MIEHLGQQLQALVEELRTVADPEVAELQIEAVTSQAAEQVATAAARASRAEQAQRRAEAERAEADAAAEDASALSQQLRTGLEEAHERLAAAEEERDRLIAELADHREKLTVAEARLVEAHGDRDAAVRRVEAVMVAQSEAEERSRNAVERADAESARAQLAEDRAESSRRDLAQADRQAADLRDQVVELRAKLAATTAQRDAAVHDVEREKAHGQQRVDDLRVRHEEENRRMREELVESRGELNRARDEASVQRRRADRAEARLDKATVARKARRSQLPAGRGGRRGETTATGTEKTRD